MIEPKWLLLKTIRAIHEMQLARHGGAIGLRDQAQLESLLQQPHTLLTQEPEIPLTRLAAAYVTGMVKLRPFVDANKRTALVAGATFLYENGRLLKADQADAVIATLRLASGEWTDEQFSAWLEQNSTQI